MIKKKITLDLDGVQKTLFFDNALAQDFKEKTGKDPVEVFNLALENARPLLEVKSQRIGGATYQVPRPVVKERGTALAVRWLLDSARKKKGQPMKGKLAEELINAANNTGVAVKKKEDTHRMAEANRAFAHFRF